MIIPITISKKGEVIPIGSASVEPVGDDFAVQYFLNAGYSFSDEAEADMSKQLKKLAREQRDAAVKNISLG
jgi:hypothetical protein